MSSSEELDWGYDATAVEKMAEVGSFKSVKPGKYHCICNKVDRVTKDNKIGFKFSFMIYDGTEPSMKSKVHVETIMDDKDFQKQKLLQFAYKFGIVGDEAAGKKGNANFGACMGRHVVIHLVPNDYVSTKTGETVKSSQIKDLWPVSVLDPTSIPPKWVRPKGTEGVPLDIQTLIKDGYTPPEDPPAPAGADPAADQWKGM
jgi:hypothetical protein